MKDTQGGNLSVCRSDFIPDHPANIEEVQEVTVWKLKKIQPLDGHLKSAKPPDKNLRKFGTKSVVMALWLLALTAWLVVGTVGALVLVGLAVKNLLLALVYLGRVPLKMPGTTPKQ